DAFRRWGYLEANLDPLGLFEPLKYPDLQGFTGQADADARGTYCGQGGADFTASPRPGAPPLDHRAPRSACLVATRPEQNSGAPRSCRLVRAGPPGALSRFKALFA